MPPTRIHTGEEALFRLPENPVTQVRNRGFLGIGEIGLLADPLNRPLYFLLDTHLGTFTSAVALATEVPGGPYRFSAQRKVRPA